MTVDNPAQPEFGVCLNSARNRVNGASAMLRAHLYRYLAELEFRYNNRVALGYNDVDRTDALLSGNLGKRLTYQTACARV